MTLHNQKIRFWKRQGLKTLLGLSLALFLIVCGLMLVWHADFICNGFKYSATQAEPFDGTSLANQNNSDASSESGLSAIDKHFNPGWVGSPCQHDDDCPYPNSVCLLPEQGYPAGYCSLACTKYCPDKHGVYYSRTFCVQSTDYSDLGMCMAGCNLYLNTSGCRPGYVCSTAQRFRDDATKLVCLPFRGTGFPRTQCTKALDDMQIPYARIDLYDDKAVAASPDDKAPIRDHCLIDTPVLLESPIHNVEFREYNETIPENLLVACKMAIALDKLAAVFENMDVVEVEHVGTYNCRGIAKTRSLSGHGLGLAIDLSHFERMEGTAVSVREHWFGSDKEKQRFLHALAKRIKALQVFDKVLTPASNRAHHDHFHLEVSEKTTVQKLVQ